MKRSISPGAITRLREVVAPLAEPDPAPRPLLGKYRVHQEIARGAMGVVYEAEDTELGRRVALKLLQELPGSNDVVRQRFQREARTAAGIDHPNVLRVYDAGEADGRNYIAMELIQGRSLREVLGEREMPMAAMLRLLEKVARGVAAAHAAGVVHRDLKPANILVTEAGEPKVGDFGLAHWMNSDTSLTKSGTPLGTPMYMAPEQVVGSVHQISPATDVFGLGSILYEVLTGRPPRTGDNTLAVYSQIIRDELVEPRRISSKISVELETICLKALEFEPARRYPTAREFAEDLRRYLSGEPILAHPAGPVSLGIKWARRHRTATIVLGVILLSALVLVAAIGIQERRTLAGFLERAEAARRGIEGDRRELLRLEEEASRLDGEVPPFATDEQRRPLWAVQRKIEDLRNSLSSGREEFVASLHLARGIDDGHPEVNRRLRDLSLEEFREAADRGDEAAMEVHRRWIGRYEEGLGGPAVDLDGRLTAESDPPGAEIEVKRYREGEDRRLEALPVTPGGPLSDLRLAAGSYLLLLRKEGFREVRCPVFVGCGDRLALRVRLYRDEEIGPDFVHVPAGPFIAGGDPEIGGAGRRRTEETGDYFIGRFEVTTARYRDFINHLIGRVGAGEAQKRTPRQGMDYLWRLEGGRLRLPDNWDLQWPIWGITWDDADAYCRWLTETSARAGGKAACRLPRSLEWEKAARGADGRLFPWGNHFEWTFAKGGESRPGKAQPEPVGAFPKDESPYGARDMSGGMMEWCEDWADAKGAFKHRCGGAWSFGKVSSFRVTARTGGQPATTDTCLGFRIVKEPPRP